MRHKMERKNHVAPNIEDGSTMYVEIYVVLWLRLNKDRADPDPDTMC